MPAKRKNISYIVYLTLLLVVFLSGVYIANNHSKEVQLQTSAQADTIITKHHLVQAKDKAPLVIPEEDIKAGNTVTIPMLMYHHIGTVPLSETKNSIRQDLTMSPQDFETEVAWIKSQGYKSITTENFYQYTQGKFKLPKKVIIFTFDDGYQDVFENAVPILKKYDYIGTFGIITQWPGQIMGTNVYASWQAIADAQKQGMEIVSHTQNHFDGSNPKFDSAFIKNNLCGSKIDLQDHLGITNDILIYPYGHYTANYITIAKQCGFNAGITVHEGDIINLHNLMEIPRIRVHGHQNLDRLKELIQK